MITLEQAKEYLTRKHQAIQSNETFKRCNAIARLMDHVIQSGFFIAPASGKYHCNFPGGLAVHTAHVMKHLTRLNDATGNVYTDETVFIVSMFHDVHKCNDMFDNPQYIPQTNTWRKNNLGENYTFSENQYMLDAEVKSLLITLKYIDLTAHEIQAILYHHGMYEDKFKKIMYDMYPLTLLLHTADMFAVTFDEKEGYFMDKTFEVKR